MEKILKKKFSYLEISPLKWIDNQAGFKRAVKWAFGFDKSEGAIGKSGSSIYKERATSEWAKLKKIVEIKVIVTGVKSVKGGGWNYRGGLILSEGESWKNFEKLDGKPYVDLGWTFNTNVKAVKNNIITTQLLELIPNKEDKTLTWLGARVLDVDLSRSTPYTTSQSIDLATRASVIQKQLLDEGETRSEAAKKFWDKNWFKMFPKSGKGKFTYHHHWQGMDEEEAKLGEKALLNTEHSLHGDLRFETDKMLWGFSVFLGKTKDNRGGDRLVLLKPDDNLQGAFKLPQPKAWLNVGKTKPLIVEPGGVGAPSKSFAKFFVEDSGTYEIGHWKKHLFEIFLKGDKLKGRMQIQFAPVADGKRVWIIDKPKSQVPFIETHDLEKEVAEAKSKRRKFLVWAKPGQKPELIDVQKFKPPKERIEKSYFCPILKVDEEKRLVTGFVMEPDAVDAHGDVTSEDEIEKAAHWFLEKSRVLGIQHEDLAEAVLLESWIAKTDESIDGIKIKKGSWLITTRVDNDEMWQDIKDGKYTGYYIGAWANRE